MATDISLPRSPVGAALVRARVRAPRWSPEAWGAIGVTALFLVITCWWLTQDRSIPTFDAGFHLSFVQRVYRELSAGHILKAFQVEEPYPPFAYLIGSLGMAIGGVNVDSPIIAENLFFVTLLALGCYQVGKRAFSPAAGLLAVVFALGSPLAIAQFHVFMIDAPETAMVAVSVWLILASEGFTRVGVSAVAGLAVGLGMVTKEPFAFFIVGVLGVTIVRVVLAWIRDGSLRWQGLAAFAIVALVVAGPWYIQFYTLVNHVASVSVGAANHPQYINDVAPARYTIDNFTWYFWNFINYQLYLPLFLFAAAGWVWMCVRLVRRQPVSSLAPELLVGAFVAWVAITVTFDHDTRYSEPILVFLAVIGTGWLVQLGRTTRIALVTVLAIVACINTLGASFGVGKEVGVSLASSQTLQDQGHLTIFSNAGFIVDKPMRDGDMLATLQALRDHGVRLVDLSESFLIEPDFSLVGLTALAEIVGLKTAIGVVGTKLSTRDASFAHGKIEPGGTPPCVRLDDGTGVWIRLGNPTAPGARDYCPTRHPAFYG
jgi:hypothetical protein